MARNSPPKRERQKQPEIAIPGDYNGDVDADIGDAGQDDADDKGEDGWMVMKVTLMVRMVCAWLAGE